MKEFGTKRAKMIEFMQSFIGEDANILFDGTAIVSSSDKMAVNRIGYNAHGDFAPQFNLMYAFSADEAQPVYYRVISGNVRAVTALSLTLEESGMKNGIIVADKGVHPELKAEEERDYLSAIERGTEGYTIEKFHEKQHEFGSITLKSNTGKNAKDTFLLYKQRSEIEQSFDFLKNLLEQDKSYMQSEKSLETWEFINHIALLLCYKIYLLLKSKDLISLYSIEDFLSHLKYIHKIKIGDI